MRFLKKMFSGRIGRVLMPLVAIILVIWLVHTMLSAGYSWSNLFGITG